MHNFRSSLAIGKYGEAFITECMPELTPLDGRGADFVHKETGELYELKTDTYNHNATGNFFMEATSNLSKGTHGGVWQAREHGSTYYMYFFPSHKVLYIFKVAELINALNAMIPTLKPILVPNKGYDTVGFKVPRFALKELYVVKQL